MGGVCTRFQRHDLDPVLPLSRDLTPRLVPPLPFPHLGFGGSVLSLSLLCVRCLCLNANSWQGVHMNFHNLPPGVAMCIFEMLVRHRMLDERRLSLFRHCWLEEIPLRRYCGLTDSWLRHFAFFEHLAKVDLTDCNALTDAGLTHLAALGQQGTVTSLSLSGCSKATDSSMETVIGALSHSLVELWLCGCKRLTDRTLQRVVRATRLEILGLERCALLTPSGLSQIRSLALLRDLRLEQCPGMTNEVLRHLAPNDCTRPASPVSRSRTAHYEAVSTDDLGGLASLTRLNVGWTSVSNEGCAFVARMASLQHLTISRCHVTTTGLRKLVMLGRLEYLDATGCTNIGGDLSWLGDHPSLNSLCLDGCTAVIQVCTGRRRSKWASERVGEGRTFMSVPEEDNRPRSASWSGRYQQVEDNNQQLNPGPVQRAALPPRSSSVGGDFAAVDGAHPPRPPPPSRDSMTDLSVASTQLSEGALKAISSLPWLRRLNLESCPISDSTLEGIGRLTTLTSLNLGDTGIGDRGLGYLRNLTSLTSLNLFYSIVTDRGCRLLCKSMPLLKELNLDSRELTDNGLRYLSSLPCLEKLDLFGAKVTDIGCAYLAQTEPATLRSLEVCGGGLTDAGVRSLVDIATLESLNVSQHAQISDTSASYIADRAPQLTSLNLSHSCVTDAGVAHLERAMSRLQTLALYGCEGVTLASIERALSNLPSLQFFAHDSIRVAAGQALVRRR